MRTLTLIAMAVVMVATFSIAACDAKKQPAKNTKTTIQAPAGKLVKKPVIGIPKKLNPKK